MYQRANLNFRLFLLLIILFTSVFDFALEQSAAQEISKVVVTKKGGSSGGTLKISGFLPKMSPKNPIFVSLGHQSKLIVSDDFKITSAKYSFKGEKSDFVRSFVYKIKNSKITIELNSTSIPTGNTELLIGDQSIHGFPLALNGKKKQTLKGPIAPAFSAALADQVQITSEGGNVQLSSDFSIDIPKGALSTEELMISGLVMNSLPALLPKQVTQLGQPINILTSSSDGNDPFLEPVEVTVRLPPGFSGATSVPSVLRYDAYSGEYTQLAITSIDYNNQEIKAQTRTFSPIVLVSSLIEAIPSTELLPFIPSEDGWSISNNESLTDIVPGGSCLGMTMFTKWFYAAHPSEKLAQSISGVDAQILAARAQLSLWQVWQHYTIASSSLFGLLDSLVVSLLKFSVGVLKVPTILVASNPLGGGAHAVLVYGYDSEKFFLYDPNFPGEIRTLPYSTLSISDYSSGPNTYSSFGIAGTPLFGSSEDFELYWNQAKKKFNSSSIAATWSDKDETLLGQNLKVKGTVTKSSWTKLLVFLNGDLFQSLNINNKKFSFTIPLLSGSNTLILLAGDKNSSWTSSGSGVFYATIDADPQVFNVAFVDPSAVGKKDGTSWKNAFTDIESAVAADPNKFQEIWVKNGTYLVSNPLILNNAVLYGSFKGVESAPDQRKFDTPTSVIRPATQAYHIMLSDNDLYLDGFELSSGAAIEPISPSATNGWLGGAILSTASGNDSVNISNCLFSDNLARRGGAIAIRGYGALHVFNSTFINNRTPVDFDDFQGWLCSYDHEYSHGSAIYREWGTSLSAPPMTIDNSRFISNQSTGGTITQFGSAPITITDSLFDSNRSYYAPALLVASGAEVHNVMGISGTVFKDNMSYDPGIGLVAAGSIYGVVTNSLLEQWGNILSGNVDSSLPPIMCPGPG